jgi:sugar lactone lactonase YvrE
MTRIGTPVGSVVSSLGECPVWSERDGMLYWIDIDGRAVHRIEPSTEVTATRDLPGRPGSMVLTADPDRLLVAVEHELVELTWSTGATVPRLALEEPGPGKRLNDGRCDPAGRYWVGSMDDPPTEHRGRGRLHRVEATAGGLASSEHRSGIGISNGAAFAPDGRTMYWADTFRDTVWAYDVDIDTGDRSNERVFLDFSDLPGRPDGACVDTDGCYWVACVFGWAVLRATPDGRVDRIVELPVEKPTMPAFGGAALDTMYVTSISDGGSFRSAADQPLAGSLLALDVGVAGVPEPIFAG